MTGAGYIILAGIFCWTSTRARHLHFADIFSEDNLTEFLLTNQINEGSHESKICTTEICKEAARDISESIDPAIDPCEDFYGYVCGGWIRNHPIPSTKTIWGPISMIEEKTYSQIHQLLESKSGDDEPGFVRAAKDVYRACMDTERIEKRGLKPLLSFLEKFGDWPMATSKWNAENFDWQRLMVDIERELGLGAFLSILVAMDDKNTSRYTLGLYSPNLAMPRYMLNQSNSTFIEAYKVYVAEIAYLVGKAKGDSFRLLWILAQSYDVVKFEAELAKILSEEDEMKVLDDVYSLVTIKKLQEWTDERAPINSQSRIKWLFLIKNTVGRSGVEVTGETQIVVHDWKFLSKLMNLIDVTPPRVLANYLLWRVVDFMSTNLNKEMDNLNFEFRRKVFDVREDSPRWRQCAESANRLSFAVGYMYVEKHFSEEAKEKATEIVEKVRKAFKQELKELAWMDAETKSQAIEKADYMMKQIGYPNWYNNMTHMEKLYEGLKIGKDHFENAVRIARFCARKMWEMLKKEPTPDDWNADPTIVNAFYNPQSNSFVLPAGILQDPFFHEDQVDALNFGGVGETAGHEITHGFDDTGRQRDKFGNIKQWWSNETEKTYLEKALCFVDQYGSYRVPELDDFLNTKVTVNGVLTLGENIADNGGLKAAVRAYLSHRESNRSTDLLLPGLDFTPEQLFYIGYTRGGCATFTTSYHLRLVLEDTHTPHRFRVIAALANSEHFARTWRCKLGTTMNPVKKCKLW